MGINRGKQFEKEIQNQFEKIEDISVDRLYDVTTGYKNQNNPCDLIVFAYGTLNYFECKAIHGNTLNFKSHIRQNQIDKLLAKSKIPRVNAGIICWFIDCDETVYIDINYIQQLKDSGKKSYNVKYDFLYPHVWQIMGDKRKVFFDYYLEDLLEDLRYE